MTTFTYDHRACAELTFVSDGTALVVCTVDFKNQEKGTVNLLNVPELKKVAEFTIGLSGFSFGAQITVVPGQREAVIAGESLQVVDLSTGATRWSAQVENKNSPFGSVALTPDGKTLFSAETSGFATFSDALIRIWDLSTGKEIGPRLKDHRMLVNRLIVTADGKTLVSAGHDQTIHLWDVSDPTRAKARGRPLRGHRSAVDTLALMPRQSLEETLLRP